MQELISLVSIESLRFDLLARLLLATLLGGAIGLERELSGKAAGFRTNLLICVGAALLTDLSLEIAAAADPGQAADPARIAAQIVSGIGFLGAGTIIQARGSVVGLTTAATLWVVAAIGMAVGAGRYVEAVGGAVLVIAALILLGSIEARFLEREEGEIHVTLDPDPELAERIERRIEDIGLTVSKVDVKRFDEQLVMIVRTHGRPRHWREIVSALLDLDGVRRVIRP